MAIGAIDGVVTELMKSSSDTDEFVVTTPRDAARKDYIGNAALHGRLAVVCQGNAGGTRVRPDGTH